MSLSSSSKLSRTRSCGDRQCSEEECQCTRLLKAQVRNHKSLLHVLWSEQGAKPARFCLLIGGAAENWGHFCNLPQVLALLTLLSF